MNHHIIIITNWHADSATTGAVLLTMPNIPLPLHRLNPRKVLGREAWGIMRKTCFKKAQYKCEVCGRHLTERSAQAHELYSYSYMTGTAIFVRCVCICDICHKGIHSGRSVTDYRKGIITKEELLYIIENVFRIVSEYNNSHKNQKPLRVYESFLRCLKDQGLCREVQLLIDKYEIEFYREEKNHFVRWGDWRLYFGNSAYKPIYATKAAWMAVEGVRNMAQTLLASDSPKLLMEAQND